MRIVTSPESSLVHSGCSRCFLFSVERVWVNRQTMNLTTHTSPWWGRDAWSLITCRCGPGFEESVLGLNPSSTTGEREAASPLLAPGCGAHVAVGQLSLPAPSPHCVENWPHHVTCWHLSTEAHCEIIENMYIGLFFPRFLTQDSKTLIILLFQ